MTNIEAIEILRRLQDPEPWEPHLNSAAYGALNMAISALEKRAIPAADVVEVVRCRECKWWRGPIYGNRCSYHSGPNHTEFYDADEFCSRGERKGGDE